MVHTGAPVPVGVAGARSLCFWRTVDIAELEGRIRARLVRYASESSTPLEGDDRELAGRAHPPNQLVFLEEAVSEFQDSAVKVRSLRRR